MCARGEAGCPDARLIFNVHSAPPRALGPERGNLGDPPVPGDGAEGGGSGADCSRRKHAPRPRALESHLGFPCAISMACWIQTPVGMDVETQSAAGLSEATRHTERLLLKSKAGWQRASCQLSLCRPLLSGLRAPSRWWERSRLRVVRGCVETRS